MSDNTVRVRTKSTRYEYHPTLGWIETKKNGGIVTVVVDADERELLDAILARDKTIEALRDIVDVVACDQCNKHSGFCLTHSERLPCIGDHARATLKALEEET
jgi:hypothetical protein